MIKSKGRMIRTDISRSQGVSQLSPESLSLFCLLIPHFNAHGKMNGEPHFIKGEVCPLVEWLTVKKIERCLTEIGQTTNVKWFSHKGLRYLQSLNFSDHQELRPDRMADDSMPSYDSPGVVQDSPGLLRPEVEGKGKEEREVSFDLSLPITYLNEKAGSKFSVKADFTRRLVKSRFLEGRTVEDFKLIIDKKCAEWLSDEKMAQYLRPSTLFNGKNFENYLNAASPKGRKPVTASRPFNVEKHFGQTK